MIVLRRAQANTGLWHERTIFGRFTNWSFSTCHCRHDLRRRAFRRDPPAENLYEFVDVPSHESGFGVIPSLPSSLVFADLSSLVKASHSAAR